LIEDKIKEIILQRFEIKETAPEHNKDWKQDFLILFQSEDVLKSYKEKGLVKFAFNNFPIGLIQLNKKEFLDYSTNEEFEAIELDDRFYLQLNEVSQIVKSKYIHNSFFGFSGKNVVVGLVDSGVDINHPDLSGRILDFHNFTEEPDIDSIGHGTAIAGAICGTGKASKGYFKGMAPDAKVIVYKLFNKSGTCLFSEFMVFLEEFIADFSIQKVDLLCFPFINPIPGYKSVIMEKYLEKIYSLGISMVSAVGNFGPDPNSIGYPATSQYVLRVGSYDDKTQPAFFSSRGDKNAFSIPDIIMKGTNIITPRPKGVDFGLKYQANLYYSISSGTSISAGILAGLCACILESNPSIKAHQLKEEILNHCYRLSPNDYAEGKGTFDLQTYFLSKNMLYNKPMPYSIVFKNAIKVSVYLFGFLVFLLFLIEYLLEKNRGL
jgi:subtilisin family serine protease